jgi:cyclophilin family peptidyl-prolyl cis-trans isomerase/HEAT repeat protein
VKPAGGLLGGLLLLCAALAAAEDSPPSALSFPGRQAGDAAISILRLEDRREFGGELLALLSSDDPVTRGRAAVAAGRIGDPRAIDPLSALTRDRDPLVRACAAFALGEIEDSAAAVPLALLLRGDAERAPHVRALAVEGLGKLKAARFAPLCVTALSDASDEVRGAAALASWQIQAASAYGDLIRLARNSSDDLRWKASYALMRMLGAAAPGRTPIPGGVEFSEEARAQIHAALVERSRDPDFRCRLAAVRGLGSFSDEGTRAILHSALSDADWRVRVEAVRALTPPRPEGAEPSPGRAIDASTLRPALGDQNPNVRISAMEALARTEVVGGATAELETLLADRDLSDREREVASVALAARWKSEIGTATPAGAESIATAITNLGRLLTENTAWSIRATAAEVLDPGNPTGLALLDRLLHDDPRVAKTAVEPVLKQKAASRPAGQNTLAAIGSSLDWLLASPDPVLRAITIETAGSLVGDSIDAASGTEWVALLKRQWDISRSDRVDDAALAIVGQTERLLVDPGVKEILRDAASSGDPQVRREARRILVAKGLEAASSRSEPIETGRSREEYASILRWAEKDHQVEIRTSRGIVRIRLFARDAPLTCWNFVRLADSGFYDRGRWHRIVPDFVAQDGCPRGDGYGGPGYTIRCEINEKRFVTGAVGMALSGKDTGGSQFFICHSPQPHLDGRYTVFGQVVDGMDVVDRLIQNDPIETVRPVP